MNNEEWNSQEGFFDNGLERLIDHQVHIDM